jgi:hypothetical protein
VASTVGFGGYSHLQNVLCIAFHSFVFAFAIRLMCILAHFHNNNTNDSIEIDGGKDYRDEIVKVIKNCSAMICLINHEWASSGECKDVRNILPHTN